MNRRALQLAAALGVLSASPALAATIDHGDCEDLAGGATVVYEQITESNAGPPGTELYRAPMCFGNEIDFDPLGFEARDEVTGNASPVDIWGDLDFAIQAQPNHVLQTVSLSEGGDYGLIGFGTLSAMATMDISLTIFVPDGGGGQLGILYVDSADVAFSGPANPDAWSIAADYVIGDILLEACTGQGQYTGGAIGEACGATSDRVAVSLGNLLEAFAQDGSEAFINKKEAEGATFAAVTTPIPEPGSAGLLALGLAALARRAGTEGRSPTSPWGIPGSW